MDPRSAAYLSLQKCEKQNSYSNIEIDASIKKYGFSNADRGLYTALVYGVIEKKIILDRYIAYYSTIPHDKISSDVRVILRLGIYQILYCDRIPNHAAVNESVDLAKVYAKKGAFSFVNAVLRAVIRGSEPPLPEPTKHPVEYLSGKYGFESWMAKMWLEMYGYDKTEAIMAEMANVPYVTLRTNTLKISRADLIKELIREGVSAEPSELTDSGVILTDHVSVSSLRHIKEGFCFVQDEASQICAFALGAKEGDLVLDACAAPGGKTFSTAINMNGKGKVLSMDIHENKLSLINRGAETLGIECIETRASNSSRYDEALAERFDRVLCDVPCSGLGIIAKKPDVRHKAEDEIKKLPQIQYAILDNCSKYLKSGGILVYSTCTLNDAENGDVVSKFLKEHPEFQPECEGMPGGKFEYTFFPDETHTDGFYIAKFKKK